MIIYKDILSGESKVLITSSDEQTAAQKRNREREKETKGGIERQRMKE
jgi:hypothetical protein